MIRIALLDADPLAREAVLSGVARLQNVEVAATAGTPDDLPEGGVDTVVAEPRDMTRGLKPLMDLLGRAASPPPVVCYTADKGMPQFVEAMRYGARGYVLKTDPLALLAYAVRVASGDGEGLVLSPRYAGALASRLGGTVDVYELTQREKKVLQLLGKEMSTEEIASALFLTPPTVKTYISGILKRTGCRDRAQLVARSPLLDWVPGGGSGGRTGMVGREGLRSVPVLAMESHVSRRSKHEMGGGVPQGLVQYGVKGRRQRALTLSAKTWHHPGSRSVDLGRWAANGSG